MKNAIKWIALATLAVVGIVAWRLCGRGTAVEAVYPVENAVIQFRRGVMSHLRGFIRRGDLSAENDRLRREVDMLSAYRADIEQLRAENIRLRAALGYVAAQEGGKWIAAPILSRGGPADEFRMFRVGRGSLAGVEVGDVVTCAAGLVGRVVSVTVNTAEVMLVTDGSSHVAVEVLGGDSDAGRLFGILSGGGRRELGGMPIQKLLYVVEPLRLRHLGRDSEPPPRSRIVTSGRGGVFPAGITVGYLVSTRKGESGLEREGEVIPAVDFAGLEDVFIRHAQ